MSDAPAPKRRPLWVAVIANALLGQSFRVVMHHPSGDWISYETGDSFGAALLFHREYRKLGFR